ncbi:MAG TPA: Calx-beta domain-containing protein [Actinomycetota bacterium]
MPATMSLPRTARALVVTVLAAVLPLAAVAPAQAARVKTIRIADASVVEGDAGTKSLSFSITWTGSKGGAAPSVHYATADGTATEGSDYTTTSGTATLTNGGCRCATVSVPVRGDATTEGTEMFVVNLSSPQNGTIGDAQAVATIYDNEGPPSLVVADTVGDEADDALDFTVSLTNDSASTVTVAYATANGTATAGDYADAAATLTFSPGQSTKTVSIAVVDDALAEDDETVLLDLSGATNATIVDAQGVGTIANDDTDPTAAIADVTVGEEEGAATFTVTLDAASGRETAVDFTTGGGTAAAGSDYTAGTGSVTVPAGETTATFDVPLTDDDLHEGDETFGVTLSGEVDLVLADTTATATIDDDDPTPTISAADVGASESAANATVIVSLSNATVHEVTLDWTTFEGTATAGADYTAASGTATIAAGQTETTIVVALLGDAVDEPAEAFSVALSNPANASFGATTSVAVTLTDDDLTPTALTAKAVKTRTAVKAKGLLEPAAGGLTVTVTLLKKKGAKYVKLAAATATVKGLKDRDGDGKADGLYVASFAKPAKGTYRFKVAFLGTGELKKSAKTVTFKL